MERKVDLKFGFIVVIILLVALSRLIPHMPNYSPMTAVALFGAAHFNKKWLAILITLVATFISDIILNNTIYSYLFTKFTLFYDGFIWQYIAYIAVGLLGSRLFSKVTKSNIILASLSATMLFFILTNFGAWVSLPLYPKSISGLVEAYTAGVPFLKGTLVSDLVYTTILFGGYYLLQNKYNQFRLTHLRYA